MFFPGSVLDNIMPVMKQEGFAERRGKKRKGPGRRLPNPWTRERACRPGRHFRRPELRFPMMAIIIFLLTSLVFRNVRNRYRGPLMTDGAFRALSAANAFFTTTSGG